MDNKLALALEGIRDFPEDYWFVQGIVPSDTGDYQKVVGMMRFDQLAIYLWLRFYLLNDLEAHEIAMLPPFAHLESEAELHRSWYHIAQEIVRIPGYKKYLTLIDPMQLLTG
jgi:hypothetical protein